MVAKLILRGVIMKNHKMIRNIIGLFAASFALMLVACGYDEAPVMDVSTSADYETYEATDLLLYEDEYEFEFDSDFDEFENLPLYASLTGTVVSFELVEQLDGTWNEEIEVETEDGLVRFLIDLDTVLFSRVEPDEFDGLSIGDTVIGFFEPSVFMAAIYPPQYHLVALVHSDSLNAHIDRFDEELTSFDGSLTITPDEDTVIMFQDGWAFDGEIDELHNRRLLVVYDVSTRSLPAIATPSHIVVLFETVVHIPGFVDGEGFDGGVVVNGELLPGAFTMGDDPAFPIYVPLMHILAALNAPVNVHRPIVTVEGLLGTITFELDSYDFDVDGEIVTLRYSAFEIDGTIFVPIPFFREVFGMNNAYVMNGTVFINNDEVME